MAQRATASIVVNATPDEVYAVVTDFERYPQWVSELKDIDVVEQDREGRGLEVSFRAAAFGRSTTYSLRYDYARAPRELSWHQTRGDITEQLAGRYRFELRDDVTKVTYDLEVELAVPIPGFVRARAAARIQEEALLDLKTRVESLRS